MWRVFMHELITRTTRMTAVEQQYDSGVLEKDFANGNRYLDEEDSRIVLLEQTNQIRELQTIMIDRTIEHSQFVFYADRLMRLVVEEALNQLPVTPKSVTTPTQCKYKGLEFARGNCGVSLCRSGEAMEIALRQCARSIRICKMLIGGEDQKVMYARLTGDIESRRILLLYPILSTGLTVLKAISALKENGAHEENIYLVALFIHPKAIERIIERYPAMTIVTSRISEVLPLSFSMKYFGTD